MDHTLNKASVCLHRCDRTLKEGTAASLTIVMLTELAGQGTDKTRGHKCCLFGWRTTQNLELKPINKTNIIFFKKTYTMRLSISLHRDQHNPQYPEK